MPRILKTFIVKFVRINYLWLRNVENIYFPASYISLNSLCLLNFLTSVRHTPITLLHRKNDFLVLNLDVGYYFSMHD